MVSEFGRIIVLDWNFWNFWKFTVFVRIIIYDAQIARLWEAVEDAKMVTATRFKIICMLERDRLVCF